MPERTARATMFQIWGCIAPKVLAPTDCGCARRYFVMIFLLHGQRNAATAGEFLVGIAAWREAAGVVVVAGAAPV